MPFATQLNVETPTDTTIVMTRSFNAPRDLVWASMTEPDLLRRWLTGPPGWTPKAFRDDLSVGSEFCWSWNGPNGEFLAIVGEYREIRPNERIVRTEGYDMGTGEVVGGYLATLDFHDRGETTGITLTLEYGSKDGRDAALASGMKQGMEASYHNLDAMLEKERA